MNYTSSPMSIEGAKTPSNSPGDSVHKPPFRRIALLELLVFLGGALLIDQLFFEGTRFRHIQPHPFWIPVVLLSVQYGSRMGLVSVLACTSVLLFGNVPERLLEQDFHQWGYSVFLLPLLWFISAIVIGEISSRHINARLKMNEKLSDSLKREATLTESFHKLNAIKERMEIRVAGQWRTVDKTLTAARFIEHQDPTQVLTRSQDLVENLLEPKQFSIYILRDNALHHTFDKGWDEDMDYLRVFGADSPIFTTIVSEKRTICISSPADEGLLAEQGILAGPLILPKTGEFLGMLKIEKLAFGGLSLNTLKKFEFLCEWIGSIYGRAIEYQLHGNSPYSQADQFFQNENFFEFYKIFLTGLANRIGFSLTMLKIHVPDYTVLSNEMKSLFKVALGQSVKDVLRRTDLIFLSDVRQGEYTVLISDTGKQYKGFVKARLQDALEEKLASLAKSIDYSLEMHSSFQITDLVPSLSKNTAIKNHHTANNNYFNSQRQYLLQLAARFNFPLTMLFIKLTDYTDLSELEVKRFLLILDKVLKKSLGSLNENFFQHQNSRALFILLPGVNESKTKHLVMVINKLVKRNWESVPVRFSHQIQVLKSDESIL